MSSTSYSSVIGQALLPKAASDALLQMTLGLLFFRLNKLEDALKLLHNCSVLEAYFTVPIYILLSPSWCLFYGELSLSLHS